MNDNLNADGKALTALRAATDERIAAIRASDTAIAPSERSFFISNSGSDSSDGASPYTAWASLERLNRAKLPSGSTVFFERGGLWRGQLLARENVAYSAYGRGDGSRKPRIYGSPENASGDGKWEESGEPDIYVFCRGISEDVGSIVFDGESCAVKCVVGTRADGSTFDSVTGQPFQSFADLRGDLRFIHDHVGGLLYLRSEAGNPSERFSEIELNVKHNVVAVTGNGVTIDNLCVKYGGAHGVGAVSADSLTVTNCEFGWIGGSIQAEGIFGRNYGTRYGNAVEIWGSCRCYRVADCYFYQIYDAAVTQQMSADGNLIAMEDVVYENNVMERCNYSVEYFLSGVGESQSHIKGLSIRGNLMWYAGRGFCEQRPDHDQAAHVKSWNSDNPTSDYKIEGNLFCLSRDSLLHLCAQDEKSLPDMDSNTYVQYEGGRLAVYGLSKKPDELKFSRAASAISGKLGDKNAKILRIRG